MNKRNKVLILISHYLPGQNIGGPLNSVRNIVFTLRSDYDFFLVTSDRDLGSKNPYLNIQKNNWVLVEDTPVMYLNGGFNYYLDMLKFLRKNSFDVLYLNSFFEFRFSIFIILLNFFNLIQFNKIVVAPRGELMDDAIDFKRIRKEIFIKLVNFLGIYKGVFWHSTATIETLGIEKRIKNSTIFQAGVLVDTTPKIKQIDDIKFDMNCPNHLKVVFISRISKEKNLIFALKILQMVTCNVEFHIYGPIEENDIWSACLEEMKKLPSNVLTEYRGVIDKDLVKSYFDQYDLFLFPTLIENFGHVISESLSVGTPVLISDRTPWISLEDKGFGWDFSLNRIDNFVKTVESHSSLTHLEKTELRKKIIECYSNYFNKNELYEQNLNIFN